MTAGRRPAPRPPRLSTPAVFPWRLVALLVGFGCLGTYAWLWIAGGRPVGSGLLVVPALLMLTAPLLVAARREPGFDLAGLMATGLFLRFAATYYRFDNAVDGGVYYRIGAGLAPSFRQLAFGVDPRAAVPGTGSVRYLSGLLQVFTGSDEFATFLVFAWIAFFGCYLLYRAFLTAVPDGDSYRYARLVFLWPSLVFWPSSIGKESVMLFTLGLAAFGAARVFTRRPAGYTFFLLGTAGAFLVRPHVALMMLAALAVALVLGRRHTGATRALTPASVALVGALALLVVVGSALAARTAEYLGIESLQLSSAQTEFEETSENTEQGGSRFSPADSTSPLGYPQATVTILFRPFPFEVSGLEQMVTSAEALALAALAGASWRRLATLVWRWRAEAYVGLALAFVLAFFFVFGAIGNFGILARERTQVLPFVFVLLAVGASARPRRESTVGRDDQWASDYPLRRG